MDFIEIQQLVNRLNIALDYCTNGGQDFADLFIEGGRFVIDEGNGKPLTFNTRQQLVSLAGGPGLQGASRFRRAPTSGTWPKAW